VDFKSFDDHHYRQLGGRLQPILDTIRRLHALDFWVEIVTLVVPGFNDSDDELKRMADFLASVSPTIPWHVTAFHADYKMTDPPDTTADILLRAAQIGKDAGLKFLYAGNLPGRVDNLENTCCAQCGALLIERWGYLIRSYQINAAGCCPKCNAVVPGRWAKAFDGQIAHLPFVPRRGRARDKLVGN